MTRVFHGGRRGLDRWERTRAPKIAPILRSAAGLESAGTATAPPAGIAVDIGCGSGALARLMAPAFHRLLAVDPVPRPGGADSTVTYLAARAEHLPIRAGRVDFVYSYGALHHTDLAAALAEVRRILAPGGVAALIDFVTADAAPSGPGRHLRAALRALPRYRRSDGLRTALAVTAFRLSPAWLAHVRTDRFLTPPEFTERYSTALPGARLTTLPGRMLAVWRKPLRIGCGEDRTDR